jgi:hypothetical protein
MSDEYSQAYPRFVIGRKGARAVMEVRNGKFVVLANSTALIDTYSGMTSYVKLKDDLILDGILVQDGSLLRFTEDVEFESVSAAANIILDRNSNGNKEWRHENTGITIKEWKLINHL